MRMRTRKLIGTILLLILVLVYGLFAMAIGAIYVNQLHGIIQFVYYVIAGLLWIFPAGLIIRWMSRPDKLE